MSTKKQIAANQANALKSTGPRRAKGKQTSSANAITHGLFAKHLRLSEEDRPVFLHFTEQIQGELQPQGPTETFYAEFIVDQVWRLRGCLSLEKDLFEWYRVFKKVKCDAGTAFAHDAGQGNSLTRLGRYAPRFERGFRKGLAELRKLQERRCRPAAPSPNPVAPLGEAAAHTDQVSDHAATCAAPVAPIPAAAGSAPPQPALAPPSTLATSAGILAGQVVLSDEDPDQFRGFVQRLHAEWQPRTAFKALLVDLLAVTSWRLVRASRLEAELFEHYHVYGEVKGSALTAWVQDAAEQDCFSKLAAYETGLQNSLSHILKELRA